MKKIKLTQFSKGGGCGCKIAPDKLHQILKGVPSFQSPNLLVGFDKSDDAAVYAISEKQAIISTADFFMPIVDDAYDFGRIAAANALSDVFAMGGKPIMAVAILGWPVEKLPIELATDVLKGAAALCEEAKIPLAGGHSIDSEEPIFGLSVTGIVEPQTLKTNGPVKEGDCIYLTKAIGTGMLSSAQKKGLLSDEEYKAMVNSMVQLNILGAKAASFNGVRAITDVTGFGLIGHLMEMIGSEAVSVEVNYTKIPLLPGVERCMASFTYPNNTTRIFNSYKDDVAWPESAAFLALCDPQTSGGLLIAVENSFSAEFEAFLRNNNTPINLIGVVKKGQSKKIVIK